ncbi:MAG: DUF5667 domain-containing protein [Candidatus Dormibacteraeota bacterium]|nr:DUF5667 domain-containing protein [Candidatus Dormibacteraeota bacterium]
MSHATAREWLIPYTDGMLSADERLRIDGHVAGCPRCGREVDALRQLNLLLVGLPPAPPVAFAPFWLRLQAALPAPRRLKAPAGFKYRRVGLAFAMAAVAALGIAGSALAAPAALPDSPLYQIKLSEESLRLALVSPSHRADLVVHIGSERLREAQVMAATGKPALAAGTVRAFRLMIPSIDSALASQTDLKSAIAQRKALDVELAAVQEANATRGDDDAEVKQLVQTSIRQLDGETNQSSTPLVVTTPASAPTVIAHPTPKPTARPTARPTPSPDDREPRGD